MRDYKNIISVCELVNECGINIGNVAEIVSNF